MFCAEADHEAEVEADDGADEDVGRVVAVEFHAGPDDGKGEGGGEEAERKVNDEEGGSGAEDGGGVAGGEALEFALEGVADAVEAVGDVGVGAGAAKSETEAVVEESGECGPEKTDDGDAPPGAAFGRDAVEPDEEGKGEIVGGVIAPGTEEISDALGDFFLGLGPEVEFFEEGLIMGPDEETEDESNGEDAEGENFSRANKAPKSAEDGSALGEAGNEEPGRGECLNLHPVGFIIEAR